MATAILANAGALVRQPCCGESPRQIGRSIVSNTVIRLPLPDHLEPKKTSRSLATSVRIYFYTLYNNANAAFRELLASVGNKDAIHGNRLFDRHVAVGLIKKAALEAKDTLTANANDGDIYRHIVNLMRGEKLGLRLRRNQYRQITHQQPAE
jgi:hypothetical protein